MPSFIENLGQGAAGAATSGAIGAGLGLLLEGHNDRRQINQQQKLQNMQIAGQKQMTDYNMSKQLQMWKDTNYKPQMEELKKAGLNPGLIYGMSGGGGVTTGNANGSVGGADAPKGGGEAMGGAGMGMQNMAQLALLKAQKENIEADTANKIAETPNKPLTGENIKADTQLKTQGVINAKTQNSIMQWEETLKRIDSNVAEQTQGDRMGQIVSLAEQAASTAEMIERDNGIAAETRADKIKQIKGEAIGVILKNELTQAQTGKTTAEISQIAAEIAKTITNMGVEWAKLGIEGQKVMLQKRMTEFNTSGSQRTYDNILRGIQTIIGGIKPGTTINQGPKETTVNNY